MKSWDAIVLEVVGKPFEWAARGPDAYDCWGIVLKACADRECPIPRDWLVDDPAEVVRIMAAEVDDRAWLKVEDPEPGDVVLVGRRDYWTHAGILTPFGLLHSTVDRGCRVSRLREFHPSLYRLGFYRWAG